MYKYKQSHLCNVKGNVWRHTAGKQQVGSAALGKQKYKAIYYKKKNKNTSRYYTAKKGNPDEVKVFCNFDYKLTELLPLPRTLYLCGFV